MKQPTTIFTAIILLFSCVQPTRQRTIFFEVDATREKDVQQISIRGSNDVLAWDKNYPLSDSEGDGIYTGVLSFSIPYDAFELKFVKNKDEYELKEQPNRLLQLGNNDTVYYRAVFNKP